MWPKQREENIKPRRARRDKTVKSLARRPNTHKTHRQRRLTPGPPLRFPPHRRLLHRRRQIPQTPLRHQRAPHYPGSRHRLQRGRPSRLYTAYII